MVMAMGHEFPLLTSAIVCFLLFLLEVGGTGLAKR
jgi:hypothetical protein